MDPFAFMYLPDRRDASIFGDAYTPPEKFEHGEWHQVALFRKAEADGDGCDVAIDESRLPARFFRLRPLPSLNSMGEMVNPVAWISTGSGDEVGHLLVSIARLMSEGMIEFDPVKED